MTAARTILPASLALLATACLLPAAATARDRLPDAVSAQARKPAEPAKPNPSEPTLLGQYQDWGAYVAAPGGKKVCFALAKPKSMAASRENVRRDQPYMFIATRPAEKVKDEISVIVGYPLRPNVDVTAEVGSASFALFSQNDGAWIKNAADEPKLIEAMRKGSEMVVKGTSTRGTNTTDTYSLMGISNALDRVAKECGTAG
jgi:invasion protein IalB